MENNIVDFVREFNTELDVLNQYSNLEYTASGFYEGINLPQVNLVNDNDYSSEHFKKVALTQLLKVVSDWGEVAVNMFADEIWAWEKETIEQVIEKFPKSKVVVERLGTLRYKIILSGKYNKESMSDFIDVIVQDFEYMFYGCKLDYEY